MDPGLAFGKMLRKVRKEACLTQEQVAHAAGVERIYIGMIERGERQPTVRVVFKLANAVNKKASELIVLTEQIVDQSEE
ncbi:MULTISPECIES: helix-turn-helix transcriptional regulator [Massilia]|uniref:helix-turn-helix transcriptional regulator n=1 Tax=Massilia TaxID=149698 RepID=UPI001E5B0EA5|nr:MULTISPECIES: helix-turn-helix transcriptional regulator [Massilia]